MTDALLVVDELTQEFARRAARRRRRCGRSTA